ncbi:hypothetical protein ACJMK2_015846, partial [Sinanodonta woodiana]
KPVKTHGSQHMRERLRKKKKKHDYKRGNQPTGLAVSMKRRDPRQPILRLDEISGSMQDRADTNHNKDSRNS